MRTWWEHIGNEEKTKNPSLPPAPPPQEERTGPLMSACWTFSLAAWNFYFQDRVNIFGLGYWQGHKLWDIVAKWKAAVVTVAHEKLSYGQVFHSPTIPSYGGKRVFMWTFLFAQPHYLWKKLALNSCWCRELMWMEIKPECFCTLYNQFLRYAHTHLRASWGK
jgi:hypothetical protein